MNILERSKIIAIVCERTACRIVKMDWVGGLYAVEQFWRGDLGDNKSMAELIANGIEVIGVSESDMVFFGGDGRGYGVSDAALPALANDEMKAALSFELRKLTPLPLEKLHWGYRLVGESKDKAALRPIRLLFVKNEDWTRWTKCLASLKMVDGIMPPEFCFDPVLSGRNGYLPDGRGGWLEYVSENSRRAVGAYSGEMTLDLALPKDIFAIGELEKLDQQEALAFVSAIILGAYGLEKNFNKDVKTVIRIPENIRAHRNAGLKIASICLAGYLLLLFGYCLIASLQGKAAQIRRLDAAINEVRAETKKYAVSGKNDEKLEQLKEELKASIDNTPEFPLVLLDLTRIVESSQWMFQNLDWKNGQISFQVQGQFKDMNLADNLEASQYIGDVTERSSSFNQNTGMYVQRFDMQARLDTAEEKEAQLARQNKAKSEAAVRTDGNDDEEIAEEVAAEEAIAE